MSFAPNFRSLSRRCRNPPLVLSAGAVRALPHRTAVCSNYRAEMSGGQKRRAKRIAVAFILLTHFRHFGYARRTAEQQTTLLVRLLRSRGLGQIREMYAPFFRESGEGKEQSVDETLSRTYFSRLSRNSTFQLRSYIHLSHTVIYTVGPTVPREYLIRLGPGSCGKKKNESKRVPQSLKYKVSIGCCLSR